MGSQFTSAVMREVSRLLTIKQLTTSPYNPRCNGMIERFNGTLKTMLKRMCAEQPRDWDRYLAPLLFAYREAPHESLGFLLTFSMVGVFMDRCMYLNNSLQKKVLRLR